MCMYLHQPCAHFLDGVSDSRRALSEVIHSNNVFVSEKNKVELPDLVNKTTGCLLNISDKQ